MRFRFGFPKFCPARRTSAAKEWRTECGHHGSNRSYVNCTRSKPSVSRTSFAQTSGSTQRLTVKLRLIPLAEARFSLAKIHRNCFVIQSHKRLSLCLGARIQGTSPFPRFSLRRFFLAHRVSLCDFMQSRNKARSFVDAPLSEFRL